MSKCLMVYFSQGGTTAHVAGAIAAGLRSAQWEVQAHNLKDGPPPDARAFDLIGIGSPVYFYRPPFNVMEYVQSLPDLQGRAFFVFVLHGTYRGDTGTMLRKILARKGAQEAGYFHCHGADCFLGYLKEGVLFSPDHPTADELAQAEAFGRQVVTHVAGQPYARPEDDRPPAPIYRVERFATNHWLSRHLFSRLFTVDTVKCTACGRCMELCPTGNITADVEGRPVWGRECLLCLTCEMKCPQDAITSPASWPLFRPFMVYNVRHALRDPALDHVRVVHSRGHTRPAGGERHARED